MIGLSRGPAFEAGLREGDVIVSVEGQQIKQMKDLLLTLSKLEVGSIIRVEYERMGMRKLASLRLVEIPLQLQNYGLE